jgi:hypothetical protein
MAGENQDIDGGTIEKIWATLPTQICHRHRTLARNQKPTDWNIEELRKEYYNGGYRDPEYFRRHIVELANRRPELQIEGDDLRLTPQGIEYCIANIPGVLDDFR